MAAAARGAPAQPRNPRSRTWSQSLEPAVVFYLDTPGGLVDAMREINQRILSARVPVLAYVAPAGARAGSAGVYITYASHLAAMAPASNIGSATPVSVGESGEQSMSFLERFLLTITNPTVAYILLSLGSLGLMLELYNPGAIFPGVIGGICLLLAFYALGTLPVSAAGAATTGTMLLLLAGLVTALIGVRHTRVVTGRQAILGTTRTPLSQDTPGQVMLHGELWRAIPTTTASIPAGRQVVVEASDGLTLRVRPAG